MREIKGTVRFLLYFYHAKAIRGKTTPRASDYVYRQGGRIWRLDRKGQRIVWGFKNYGEMIGFINEITRKSVKGV